MSEVMSLSQEEMPQGTCYEKDCGSIVKLNKPYGSGICPKCGTVYEGLGSYAVTRDEYLEVRATSDAFAGMASLMARSRGKQ